LVVDTPVGNHSTCKYEKLPGMKYPYILYGPNNNVAHYEKTGTFSNISYGNFSVYVKQVHLVTFLIVISVYMCYSLSVWEWSYIRSEQKAKAILNFFLVSFLNFKSF
jgi:hypothetical protein